MNFSDHIYNLLSSTEYGPREKIYHSIKSWPTEKTTLYVSNAEIYNDCLENIYGYNKKIFSRFSRETVFKYINEQIPALKKSEIGKLDSEDFFKNLLSVEPKNLTITTPISGIRLNNNIRDFSIPPYKFGYLSDLDFPISNENGLYISVEIKDVYDRNIAISKAENAFLDFSRLVVFISGKLDHSILISTGLPLMPSYTHELMYVKTSSYQIFDEKGNFESGSISNKNIEKVPVNNDFSATTPYLINYGS